MRRIVRLATAAVALVVMGIAIAGIAAAGTAKSVYHFRSALVPGGEVPKPKAPAQAKGLFTATVSEAGSVRTLRWKLTFSGLSGKAVAAHVHRGKAGVAGGVLVPLCGPCRSGQTGQLKISKDAADLLEGGLAYVNVHTARNAAGEIRGQVELLDHIGVTPPPQATDPVTTSPDPNYGGPPPSY